MSTEPQQPKSLAAVVFENGDEANRIMADFAALLGASNVRLGGFVQINEDTQNCGCKDTFVLDLQNGSRLKLLQDLGAGSQGCRLDTAALAVIGQLVTQALLAEPQLVIINRFGKLEAEGKGLRDEIAAAALSGIPTLVCVATRFLDDWRLFAGDMSDEIGCTPAALHDWWLTFAKIHDASRRTPAECSSA